MTFDIEPGSIIVGVDGSVDSDRALRWGAEEASRERRPLVVVTAAGIDQVGAVTWAGAGSYVVPVADLVEQVRTVAQAAAADVLRLRPGLHVTAHAATGDPREALVQLSSHARVVVVGSRGRGSVRSRLLGSVSASVARHAHCPVVVCRPDSPGIVRKGVLVGVAGAAEEQPVLDFAFQHASMRGLPLTVQHSFSDVLAAAKPGHPTPLDRELLEVEGLMLAESVAGYREKYPEVTLDLELSRGFAQETLTADSEHWNLIVVGQHPTDSVARMLSATVATAVIEHARTTVAVVPVPAPA